MKFGVALASMIPLRKEPAHQAEIITQILFGELYQIRGEQGDWFYIQSEWDGYEGWINENQSVRITEQEFIRLLNVSSHISLDLVQLLANETRKTVFPVLLGSSLRGLVNHSFTMNGEHYVFDGQVSEDSVAELSNSSRNKKRFCQDLLENAMLYLHAPYLWGGRSPFGLDCSGFVQMVFKLKQVRLLRDTTQQATQGEVVGLLEEAEPADLVFFDDKEGRICHVGLLLDRFRVIHACGKVRIDPIDHEGIYDEPEGKYTHRLRMIRRII